MVSIDDIVYKYDIRSFFAYPTKDNFQDVVFSINWNYEASYTDPATQKIYKSSFSTITKVDTDNISSFIPFEDLTLEQTIEWINAVENINSIKQNLCDQINNQINPPPPTIVILPPPFSQ